MKQAALLDVGAAAPPACPMCGGPIRSGRCRPCQKDTPPIGGAAHDRWTRGIDRVVRARLDGAGLGRFWAATWEALMLDTPIPAETAPLVADIARLPFSHRRHQRLQGRALLHSQLETMLCGAGYPNGERGSWVASNIAGAAADLIMAQRDRVEAGEAFERVHDAELVHQAVLEHGIRAALRAKGLRGQSLDVAVRARVEREMALARGTWGRPSDEYPTAARFDVEALRVALPGRIDVDDEAVLEAAEDEAAEAPREGRAG